MSTNQILTVTEVALELRCSKAHVYNVFAANVDGVRALPAILIGRRKLVRRSELEDWMMASKTAQPRFVFVRADVEARMSAHTNV